MHVTTGVHPLVLRRHRLETRRGRKPRFELFASVGFSMLFLLTFACGLRWIDHAYALPSASDTPAPAIWETDVHPSGGLAYLV